MILCSQWISSDSGMSGTRRHIRLCHYTPTWPPPFQWTSPCVPCFPFKHRLRHKAKLELPSYSSRCPLFHIYTCITRLAPSVVDNMYRQALLRWMIQFFSDTDILNSRDVPIHRYRHRLISVSFSNIGIGLMKIEPI